MSGLWTKMGSPHPQPPKKNQKKKKMREGESGQSTTEA